jgi:membrane-associated protease RseP (regulator of RpoE activity)
MLGEYGSRSSMICRRIGLSKGESAMFGLGVALFAAGLLLSVALHEFGHFYPARKFGVRVSQFMVGFGPTIFSRRRGETEYGIKAIPLGGYVRIIGMIPPRPEIKRGPFKNLINQARATAMADLQEQDQGRAFYQLHPAKKLVVMLGGPIMNLLIAVILLFIALVIVGTPQPTTKVDAVITCLPAETTSTGECASSAVTSPAARAGLLPNDEIVAIDGEGFSNWDQLVDRIDQAAGQRIDLTVRRAGSELDLVVQVANISTNDELDGYLGFTPVVELARQSPVVVFEYVGRVGVATAELILDLPQRLANIVATAAGAQPRDLDGPISIVGVGVISGDVATQDAPASWRLLDFLMLLASVNLALFFFNLLPILPLDGGHVAGATFEWLRRGTRSRHAKDAADIAKLMPAAYVFAIALLTFSVLLIYVDLVAPIRLN